MKQDVVRFLKRSIAVTMLALFVSDISAPVLGAAWANGTTQAQAGLNVSAVLKDEVGLEDSDILKQPGEFGSKPNVLFMIDATAGMSFSMKSAVPSVVLAKDWKDSGRPGADWVATKSAYGYTAQEVINMMLNATYGIGAMPVAWSGATLRPERNLYGRDIDSANNYKKMSLDPLEDLKLNGMNYYAPFKDTGDSMIGNIKNAYAKQMLPLQVSFDKFAPAAHVGTSHWSLDEKELGTVSNTDYIYSGNGNISNAKRFPYALIFKNPNYWENGMSDKPVGYKPNKNELVPNDSRMYQAKRALWNLLDSDEIKKSFRFGLASTFLPTTNDANFCYDKDAGKKTPPYYKERGGNHDGLTYRYDFSGMYKVEPFGANVWTSRKFNGTTPGDHGKDGKTDGKLSYKNGVLTQEISGQIRGYNAIHAQYYPMWQHKTVDTIYTMIARNNKAADVPIEKNFYKLQHRASLLVPICGAGDEWNRAGLPNNFSRPKMTQTERVRQWINGFADLHNGSNTTEKALDADSNYRTGQYHYYKDPEIGVAGSFVLPHAIFPDPTALHNMSRREYVNNVLTEGRTSNSKKDGADGFATSVWYSHKAKNTDYVYDRSVLSTQLEDEEAMIKSRFNAGSGEAAGSVLDFFSPPKDLYLTSLSEVSYPIRSACEPNWLVVFTTGQELEVPAGEYSYTTAQAIKNLFDATNKANKGKGIYERVSMLVRGKDGKPTGSPILVDLDKPIQTLVIGMIPKWESMPEGNERNVVKKMHRNLVKMAVAGRGGNPNEVTYENMGTFEDQPFIASDPTELSDKLNSAMTLINDSAVMQPSSGAPLQSEALDDLGENSDMYSYDYKIMKTDQWEAELKREIISRDESGDLRFVKKWTLGEKNDTKIMPQNGDRKIYYWKPDGLTNALSELRTNDADFRGAAGLDESTFVPPSGNKFDVTPQDALIRWLKGKDYSYADNKDHARSRMLADFGRGGIAMVNDPVAGKNETLSGHRDWAQKIKDEKREQKPLLYAQTNDGLLHIIDPYSGIEIKAILPPPMLIPSRLASLKASLVLDKRHWINDTGASASNKSYPAFTLDGSLQKRNFDLDQTGDQNGWGQYVLGTLGRGGNGLYMIDASSRENPGAMWYRENVGGKLIRANWTNDSASTLVYTSADLTQENEADLGYLKLGFNSPKPVMCVAPAPKGKSMQNFIALAGGVRSQVPFDKSQNGGEGATLLFIDPKDGKVLKALTSESLQDPAWRVGAGFTGLAPYMGMMVSEPFAVRSAKNNYLTGSVIAADNRGNIFRVEMEDRDSGAGLDPSQWTIKTLATLQTDAGSDNCYSIPEGVVVSLKNSGESMWIAGGTADVVVRKNATNANEDGVMKNESQTIFSFESKRKTDTRSLTRKDMKGLTDEPGSFLSPDSASDAAFSGWYINLKGRGMDTLPEYVSTKPLLVDDVLFIATFIPKTISTNDSSLCVPARALRGDSRIYAVDIHTGKPAFWSADPGEEPPKYVDLKDAKVTSMTKLGRGGRDMIHVRLDRTGTANIDDVLKRRGTRRSKDVDGNPTGDLDLEFKRKTNQSFPAGKTLIEYWVIK
jgi:hypothetical protein